MKSKVKLITIFLTLILILNLLIPTITSIAAITGNVTISFNGPWSIGDISVTASETGEVTIDATKTITLTNFNPSTMQAKVYASDGFSTDLIVTNGTTSISTATADSFPNGKSLEFKVESKSSQLPPQSNTYNVNFGTATWTVDDVVVTATITGKTINNSQNIVIGENETITLSNFDPDNMEARITENANIEYPFSTVLNVDNDGKNYTTKILNRTNDGGVPNDLIFEVKSKSGNPDETIFNGHAYFVWIDNEENICYHRFTDLQGSVVNEDNNIEYIMNYINVTQLTDQSGNNSDYVWGQENANWVLASDMEDEKGDVLTTLTKEYLFGDDEFNRGVQLDPCGAENGENSIATNGDRNFRASIYRDGYQAIQFSSSEKDYIYFPRFWDPVFFSSVVDVSGTTKNKPVEYNSYLLEPTITFSGDLLSAGITAVEALDINQEAVDIENNEGLFTITFNSNYYDNVVFKITAGGESYYIKINRMVIDVTDNFAPGVTDTKLFAELYYPQTKSYNDFEVVATIIYKDGTSETRVVPVSEYFSQDNVDDFLIDAYTLNGGKGLSCSQFSISIDKDRVEGVYYTVVNKGALNGDNYGGTFSGSGLGLYYNIETRRVEL